MLHLLVDTSVWLDLAKRRDGQKLIHALGQVVMDGDGGRVEPVSVRAFPERSELLANVVEVPAGMALRGLQGRHERALLAVLLDQAGRDA